MTHSLIAVLSIPTFDYSLFCLASSFSFIHLFSSFYRRNSYIEVFKSNYTEARASIINDTQSVARQKTDHNTARQGNYGNNRGAPSNTYNNSNNNTMNSYDQGPPPNQYDSYNGSGNNYSTGSSDNGSVKRESSFYKLTINRTERVLGPMSSSFTIKLRGVPFEAGQKEIFEVR